MTRVVLILGSAPNALEAQGWPRGPLSQIVAINNAWRVRPDWDVLIYPEDFPPENRPPAPTGRLVEAAEYVPVQNRYGGFVYAGGTMAFTAGYWALGALQPDVMAFFGCDMVYAQAGNTHFYGTGAADPLRQDVTLRNLEAKSARLMLMAAAEGCACVNLSAQDSRLVFPRASLADVAQAAPQPRDMRVPLEHEARLGYMVASGRYWREEDRFDTAEIDALDAAWLKAAEAHEAA